MEDWQLLQLPPLQLPPQQLPEVAADEEWADRADCHAIFSVMNYSNCLHFPQVHLILDAGFLPGHVFDCDSVAFVAVAAAADVVAVDGVVVVVVADADADAFGLPVEVLHS